jgi:hypothetical protein
MRSEELIAKQVQEFQLLLKAGINVELAAASIWGENMVKMIKNEQP